MTRRLIPGAFKRALSTTQGFSTAAPSHRPPPVNHPKQPARRHLLKVSGFAKYSCREDLWALIDKADVPRSAVKSIDAVLNPSGVLPTNVYILELRTAEDLDKLHGQGFYAEDGTYMLDNKIKEEELQKLALGSKWNVDERCVRVSRVHTRVHEDELSFFLRDYNLAPQGIEKIKESPRRAQPRPFHHTFIVRLESPDEAQRLLREMQHAKLGHLEISIVPYK